MNGSVAILNVGDGDTKLSFNSKDPAETLRAKRIIRDMLKRGYLLLVDVEGNGEYSRALDFDEKTSEYIIADFDSTYDPNEDQPNGEITKESEIEAKTPRKTKGKKKTKRVQAKDSKAVAVGRVSGG